MNSRQKLIDKLKHWHLTNTEHGITWLPEHFVAEAIEVLSHPPASQWIPCSERLPDKSMDLDKNGIATVLVTWEFDDMWFNGCFYCDVIDYDLEWNSFIISEKKKVTAWKPVEPYKGVE